MSFHLSAVFSLVPAVRIFRKYQFITIAFVLFTVFPSPLVSELKFHYQRSYLATLKSPKSNRHVTLVVGKGIKNYRS